MPSFTPFASAWRDKLAEHFSKTRDGLLHRFSVISTGKGGNMRRTEKMRAVNDGFEKLKMLLVFHGIEIKSKRRDLEIAPVDYGIQLLCQFL